ncbi:MAG: conjugal transfer protein TraG N-terminal domain-containing protein [Smithellaceae bacterium]
MKTKSIIKIIIIAGIIFKASASYALDMDYYTWNGFDIEVEAWRILTLIFADNGYKTLFFAVITMGIFLGGFGTIFGLISGTKQGSSLSWAWPLGLGVVLYLALIVPKGNLTIYDPVANKFQTIPQVPNGLVAVAGILNKIEKGLSDIITTSGGYPPGAQYDNAAGGIGLSTILAFTGLNTMDAYLNQSLDEYVKECVIFEMEQPTPAITMSDLDTTNDLLTVMGAAANPAVWVTYWDSSNPGGTTLTCSTAWANLNNILNQTSTYNQWEKKACSSAGFNTNDPIEVQRCESILGSTIEYLYDNPSFGATSFILNMALAQRLDQVIKKLNPELTQGLLANKQASIGGEGATIVSSQYIPIAKAIFKAIIIGMIPFLILFLPTTLSVRTLGIVAGFFIFVTCWGICDVIIHNLVMVRTFNELQNIRDHGMSYTAATLWPTAGQRALNLYGNMRAGSVMFAAVISAVICKFGNYALTSIAGGVSGMITSTGNHIGGVVREPQTAAAYTDSLRGSFAPQLNARNNDFELDAFARGAKFTGTTAGDITAMQEFGGASKTIEQYRTGTAGNTVDQVSAGSGKYDAGLGNVIDISRGRAAGGVKGQIDRQQSSEYKDKSLREGAEVIQRHQSASEPVIGDTGISSSMRGENKEGWQLIENQHGIRYEQNERTPWAQVKNFNPQMTLSNKAELNKSAAKSLQNDIRWNNLYTNAEQFAVDNRTSKETAFSAQKDISREFSKRVSEDNSLSETVRQDVRKDVNTQMQVGYRAGGWMGLAPYGHFAGGMTIGKTKSDGEQGGHTLTSAEAEALNKIYRESESHALRSSLSNADSHSWGKQLNESVGSAQTKSIQEMALRSVSLTENQSQNITGEMIDYVKQKYDVSGDQAMEMLNKGYDGRDADTSFVASNVLMGKNIAEAADNKINNIQSEVEDNVIKDQDNMASLKNDVNRYTSDADLKRINSNDKPHSGEINEDEMNKMIEQRKAEVKAREEKMSPAPQLIQDAFDATKNKLKSWGQKSVEEPSTNPLADGHEDKEKK